MENSNRRAIRGRTVVSQAALLSLESARLEVRVGRGRQPRLRSPTPSYLFWTCCWLPLLLQHSAVNGQRPAEPADTARMISTNSRYFVYQNGDGAFIARNRRTLFATMSMDQQAQLANCPSLPPRRSAPTSVHDLRIDDISVIAAMGDSITAAFAAKGLPTPGEITDVRHTEENRGASFVMGGDVGAVTLPNFIRRYNPQLKGFSVGDHLAEVCYGPLCLPYAHWPTDHLNAAQTGSLVMNLERQLAYLTDAMILSRDIDFHKDFKLISLFIGSNDLCAGCSKELNHTFLSPDAFEAQIRYVLNALRRNIPRTVVNIQMELMVSQTWDLTNDEPWCATLRASGLAFECTCAFLPGEIGVATRKRMDAVVVEYNRRLIKIASDFQSGEQDPSFMVILDPLFSNVTISEWGMEHVSDVDCFHPSLLTHALMAIGVWSNLFVPFKLKASKLTRPDPSNPPTLFCPTEASRLQF
ncbi:hypothetical protein DFJ73DRAFT_845372 [Zopfochytrium polystomum]|nr:hypothetical protein DFJ73DRAFT_845372 [Zopfochytrium polystomum]